jgi:hypothetical protein
VVCDDVWLADVWLGGVWLAEADVAAPVDVTVAAVVAVVAASSARARLAPTVDRAANSK